ncbi:MAG: hypothetical protein V3R20_02970 [Sphingomonadales bacterium]
MTSASANPLVVTSAVRSPWRSKRALVATVVPSFRLSIVPGRGSLSFKPRISRMPKSAAS